MSTGEVAENIGKPRRKKEMNGAREAQRVKLVKVLAYRARILE